MNKKRSIGFIGTGVMGSSIAGHLLEAGYELFVNNRTRSKTDSLVSKGAVWKSSPKEVVDNADVVFTILGYPQDVEAVYLSEQGLVNSAEEGTILIDMTTSNPLLAVRISEAGFKKGVSALDAPVSGGDLGARNATLSIMVGGDVSTFEQALPLFKLFGKNIVYQGPSGSGQHTKMANQIAIASGMLGVCESLAYSIKAGLDPKTVLKSIEAGAAGSWSLSQLGPRMLAGDMAPGFYVKHFIKDMRIALESAQCMNMKTPGLDLTLKRYLELESQFGGDEGTQSLFRLYEG